jgi:hypothetical protein
MLRNPKTKKGLLNLARFAGQNGVRAIQGRRKRLGKQQYFPKVAAYRLSGANLPKVAQMPIKLAASVQAAGKAERAMKYEVSSLLIPTNATPDGAPHYTNVSPLNQNIWAVLADKATNFQKYSLVSLKVDYKPTAGYTVNGQMVVGFTPFYLPDLEEIPTQQSIANLPFSFTCSVAEPYSAVIPINSQIFSKGGKDLIMPLPSQLGDGADDSLRFLGTMVWTTYDCSVATGTMPANAGKFAFQYVFQLSSPAQNVTTSSVGAEWTDTLGFELTEYGRGLPTLETPHTGPGTSLGLNIASSRSLVLMTTRPETVTLNVNKDGVALTPTLTLTDTTAHVQLEVFAPAYHNRPCLYEVDPSSTATTAKFLWIEARLVPLV